MKQLLIADEQTDFFFEDGFNLNELGAWLEEILLLGRLDDEGNDDLNPFNLNEPHSCDVNEHGLGVIISGDEDYVTATLKDVVIEETVLNKPKEEKTYICGISDDLIEVFGNISAELDRYSTAEKGIKFVCSDGTAGTIKLSSSGKWVIESFNKGLLYNKRVTCPKDGEHSSELLKISNFRPYSQILILNEGIEWIMLDGEMFKPV